MFVFRATNVVSDSIRFRAFRKTNAVRGSIVAVRFARHPFAFCDVHALDVTGQSWRFGSFAATYCLTVPFENVRFRMVNDSNFRWFTISRDAVVDSIIRHVTFVNVVVRVSCDVG